MCVLFVVFKKVETGVLECSKVLRFLKNLFDESYFDCFGFRNTRVGF